MRVHEAVARALGDNGLHTVFGVLGDGNLFMMDSYQRGGHGRFYSMCNESGAVLAANGYAKTSGALGVATVTHGPALTNTVTALVESVKDHTPLLLIAGDTSPLDRENLQDIDQRAAVLPTGAGFERLRAPETIAEDLATAIRRAMLERRPIVLNVPIEFQWAEVDYEPTPTMWIPPQATAPDPGALDAAVGALAAARRPLVLAGQGAAHPEGREALIRLADRVGAPLATTLRARDLFHGHPANLGIFGTLAHELASETIAQSDCIIAFGASLNKWTTAEGSLLKNKNVIHVDIDRAAIERYAPVSVGVVGDVAAVATTIISWLNEAEIEPTRFASPQLSESLVNNEDADFRDLSTQTTVDLRTALMRIDSQFPANRTLVFDVGRFVFEAFKYLRVPEPRAYVHTLNYASIGLGMGNAVGAYLGAPERPVLLVTGDGGFMLGGLTEFNSAVRHNVDLVVLLFNDGAYGAEYVQFRNRNMDPSIATFDWPDFAPIATALGGQGYTVRNLAELDDVISDIQTRDRPVLVDIRIDPDEVRMGAH